MKLRKYITISLLFTLPLFSSAIEQGLLSPQPVGNRIIATDIQRSQLYLVENNEARPVLAERGCGAYFTLSPDKEKIGIKIINDQGLELPAIFNLTNRQLQQLHAPSKAVGQVSFSDDGRSAWTVGNTLYISDGRKYDLGTYANLAPISPNGRYVAFNDNDDQIFILDLETVAKTKVTEQEFSYYHPQWSPDSRQLMIIRFDGQICIFSNGKLTALGEGHSPVWQNNETILFYKKEIHNMILMNTDIYAIKSDGSKETKLTHTPDKMEVDPIFDEAAEAVVYSTLNTNSIESLSVNHTLLKATALTFQLKENEPAYFTPLRQVTESILDVPYLHQVYDVPDWYWGYYACAPTTAAMVLAYFNILPEWETTCSSPTRHKSNYGRYICEKYRYNEWYYADGSKPNGYAAGYGGYGYMWGTGGSPNSRMLKYYEKHGLTGSQSWNAQGKWSEAVSEISNGFPYSMCVWLTGSGHLVLGRGIVADKHSIVVNDPYGNRNTPGYPSYDGAGAIYDWPGYNHGNINLALQGSGLPWVVTAHYERPVACDSLIDDKQFGQGFHLNTQEPASMIGYADKKAGYKGHHWIMLTRTTQSLQYAEWCPTLNLDGNYELFVYIPEGSGKTQNALYKIYNGEKWELYSLNQSFVNNDWASLGIYSLEAGQNTKIRLMDSTSSEGEILVIDALKWCYVGDWQMDFTARKVSGPLPHTAVFQEQIEYESPNCDYYWDFGDGTVSDLPNPAHTYKTPGSYDVTLTLFIGPKEYRIMKENFIEVSDYETGDFTLETPGLDGTIDDQSPTFCWEMCSNTQYLFYLGTTSDFSNISPLLLDTNTYVWPDTLADNCEYFWRVRALAGDDTLTSNVGYFQINKTNDNPSTFALVYPPSETVLKNEVCIFQWEKSGDSDLYDAVTYTLHLWTDGDSALIYTGNKSFCTDTLADNTTCYWRITAWDENGGFTINNGDKSRFYVNRTNDAPSKVRLLTPENGGTSNGQYPQFSWTPAMDIDPLDTVTYEIYIFKKGRETSGVTRSLDTTFYDQQKISSDDQYGFTVTAWDKEGAYSQSDTSYFFLSTTSVTDAIEIPLVFRLFQNYPNPFNPSTKIAYDLPMNARVRLNIYDINGNLMETLVDGPRQSGHYTHLWEPASISSGVYFYKITVQVEGYDQEQVRKCLLIK
ncbi:MAG: PKD domain-containing protein [Candidatus Marinimicrobia bacterium]|nr:PKD domain-containing protein [Candidatus Neomarinimicrobiota bacterium]